MTPFSFVVVLVSLVLALGLTRVLTGVGQMIQARDEVRGYWVHWVWTVVLFLFHVQFWWTLYRVRGREGWLFLEFVAVLLPPTFLYLMSVVHFPEDVGSGVDFRRYYYEHRSGFFLLLATTIVTSSLLNALLGGLPPSDGWLSRFGGQAAGVVLSLVAAWTRDERYHAALAVAMVLVVASTGLTAAGQAALG